MNLNTEWKLCLFAFYLINEVFVYSLTKWSNWSPCSRTCGGGVAYQTRTCSSEQLCQEEIRRYKICNIEGCPEREDSYRLDQCTEYNEIPYNNKLFTWYPVYSKEHPCSLLCTPSDHSFITELNSKVADGTKCRTTGLDVCINGSCMNVGCDYELNSGLTVDICGECGGDGSSCQSGPEASQFETSDNADSSHLMESNLIWKQINSSQCSVSCGVGYRYTVYQCFNTKTDKEEENTQCEKLQKKPNSKERCAQPDCVIPVWISGPWQPCSKSCGGGLMKRYVYCMERLSNGSFIDLDSNMCTGRKLITEKPCNIHPCPTWHAGQWSPCSVTCGIGTQKREVICKSTEHYICSKSNRPPSRRRCRTKTSCTGDEALRTSQELKSNKKDIELYGGGRVSEGHADVMEHGHSKPHSVEIPIENHAQPDTPASNSVIRKQDDWLKKNGVNNGFSLSSGSGEDATEVFKFGDEDLVHGEPSVVIEETPSEPHYETSDWSSCSTTCGLGTRSRNVQCTLKLPNSQIVQYLPDEECRENRPEETESCYQAECPPVVANSSAEFQSNTERIITSKHFSNKIFDYEWLYYKHGPCSAPCLGGLSHAEFQCVRLYDRIPVKDVYCLTLPKPILETKLCNQGPCPPRWRMHGFGPCSANCGGGHMVRRVECIQEVRRDPREVNVIADHLCPDPIPPRLLQCSLIDCPAAWETEPWSKCTVTCGKGIQKRVVNCYQVIAPGKIVNVTDEGICPSNKPATTRQCEAIPCPILEFDVTQGILVDSSRYVQLKQTRKISLSVGGSATVIPGTNIVVKCPVKKYDKKAIHWKRKENEIPKKGRIKVSKQGSLQIRRSKNIDTDLYECMVVDNTHIMDQANISINFHSGLRGEEELEWRKHYMMKMLKHKEPGQKHSNEINIIPEIVTNDKLLARPNDKLLINTLTEEKNTSVPYMFVATPWSSCTKTCGGAGYQMRNISCELVTENYYRVVNESLCKSLGQEKPIETRDCGFSRCPVWMVGEWSQCSGDSCFTKGVGTMVRPIYCVFPNGSETNFKSCNTNSPPHTHQPCSHEECTATWTVSKWSPCSLSCGGEGTRTRILKCVWQNNNLPAGIHCRGQPRPKTAMACKTPPCHKMVCKDKSKYCNLVPMLKLCKYKAYKQECCYSCKTYKHHRYRKG